METDLKLKIMKSYISELPERFIDTCSRDRSFLQGNLPIHREAREEFYKDITKLYNELYAIRQEYPSLFYSRGEG